MVYGKKPDKSLHDELARHWLTSHGIKLTSLEMYVESDDDPNTPDKPVIMNYHDNFTRAKKYFKAKDYATAGNYLRKECERTIKNLLPDTYLIDNNGTQIHELEPLLQKLEELYKDSNQPYPSGLINSLKIYRKLILNPSSHNDLECPLFRKELVDAFSLVEELIKIQKIERKKILDKNDVLTIKYPVNSYEMEINPCENIFSCLMNSNKTYTSVPFKFFIKKWNFQGMEYGMMRAGNVIRMDQDKIDKCLEDKRSLVEIFDGINISIGVTIPSDLEAAVEYDHAKTLKDLIK